MDVCWSKIVSSLKDFHLKYILKNLCVCVVAHDFCVMNFIYALCFMNVEHIEDKMIGAQMICHMRIVSWHNKLCLC